MTAFLWRSGNADLDVSATLPEVTHPSTTVTRVIYSTSLGLRQHGGFSLPSHKLTPSDENLGIAIYKKNGE